jgi:hypothetical protein
MNGHKVHRSQSRQWLKDCVGSTGDFSNSRSSLASRFVINLGVGCDGIQVGVHKRRGMFLQALATEVGDCHVRVEAASLLLGPRQCKCPRQVLA